MLTLNCRGKVIAETEEEEDIVYAHIGKQGCLCVHVLETG